MIRKISLVFLSFSMAFLSAPGAESAGVVPSTVPYLGLQLRESFHLGTSPSALNTNDQKHCPTFDDKACIETYGVWLSHNWDVCTPNSKLDCIDKVWAIDSKGTRIEGEYLKSVPSDTRYDYPESVAMNRPSSRGMGGIWQIPGVVNSAGNERYFVSAKSNLYMYKYGGTPLTEAEFRSSDVEAAIMAIEETPGTFNPIVAVNGGHGGSNTTPDGSRCVAPDSFSCNKVVSLPEQFRFGMSIKLSKPLVGWFHGRFFQPKVTINSWKKGQIISLEAVPVRVPSLDFLSPNNEIVDSVKKLVFNGREWGHSGGPDSGMKIASDLSEPITFDLIKAFAPMYKDKATTTENTWSFKTLVFQGDWAIDSCTAQFGSLAGLVTTNALSYSAGAPKFNKESGILEYQVASPHLEASGQVASGTYDLALQGDVARCIYGFSNAPIKAEVSVTGDDGENRVATTVVNESGGWLYMSAKGFTFSAPKIQVKLTQEKSNKISSKKAKGKPKASGATKKASEITCTKGKITKKVVGVSPKCPKGFAKK